MISLYLEVNEKFKVKFEVDDKMCTANKLQGEFFKVSTMASDKVPLCDIINPGFKMKFKGKFKVSVLSASPALTPF